MSGSATEDATATLGEAQAAAVTTLVDELEANPSEFDVFEGAVTGMLYVSADDDYLRAEVTPEGLDTTRVAQPQLDEEIESVAHIEPDEDETIEDAVDSITFAGD
jgi:hypothetical protein